MAYNPNELAKVKHIIALAKAISGDLDGDLTDTRTTPTFSVNKTTFSKASAGSGASNETENGYTTNSEWCVHWTVTYNGDGALSITPVAGLSVAFDKTDDTTYTFMMSMPKTPPPRLPPINRRR